MAQDAVIFPDARHIRLATPKAREIVGLFRAIYRERLTTRDQDFSAATQSFTNGEGGIFPVGTWMIGAYDTEARTPGRALYHSYSVLPYPPLWGHEAAFVDGHAWVMPRRSHTPAQRQAIVRFLRFLARYNGDWARTGQLPAFRAVYNDPRFLALPHRSDIAAMAATGSQLPDYVRRQSAVQEIVGEELEAAITGVTPIEQALETAERRVNALLAHAM